MFLNKKQVQYKEALHRMFNSGDGKIVLAHLKQTYVDATALGDTPELTYYKLALKELIISWIRELANPEELDKLLKENQNHDGNY